MCPKCRRFPACSPSPSCPTIWVSRHPLVAVCCRAMPPHRFRPTRAFGPDPASRPAAPRVGSWGRQRSPSLRCRGLHPPFATTNCSSSPCARSSMDRTGHVRAQALHERAVDLEAPCRPVLQLRQRAVARPGAVDREVHLACLAGSPDPLAGSGCSTITNPVSSFLLESKARGTLNCAGNQHLLQKQREIIQDISDIGTNALRRTG